MANHDTGRASACKVLPKGFRTNRLLDDVLTLSSGYGDGDAKEEREAGAALVGGASDSTGPSLLHLHHQNPDRRSDSGGVHRGPSYSYAR